MAANRNLMCGKEQSKVLLLALAFEFSEGELIERQEKRALGRNLNA
jgi:hypothetical protein